jgi:hypothetical protein
MGVNGGRYLQTAERLYTNSSGSDHCGLTPCIAPIFFPTYIQCCYCMGDTTKSNLFNYYSYMNEELTSLPPRLVCSDARVFSRLCRQVRADIYLNC